MVSAGRLRIGLHAVAGQANRVGIRSSRPLQATRIFVGKRPQEVLAQLPLLFSICAVAQAAAGAQAMRRALAIAAPVRVDTAHAVLIQMETAREHVLRVLIDWPEILGEPADARPAAPLQAMLAAMRTALFADSDPFSLGADVAVNETLLCQQIDQLENVLAAAVFGTEPAQWLLIRESRELLDWAGRAQSVAARMLRHLVSEGWEGHAAADSDFLPELSEAELDERLKSSDAERFVARPTWRGRTCETTSLSRQFDHPLIRPIRDQHGNGLLARLAAQLVELAAVPATMRSLAARLNRRHPAGAGGTLPAGVGIGQVEAARGRLVHRVELAGGRVQSYQTVAPTEWNFHPSGVAAEGLRKLPCADRASLRRQADMLICAVDPCVAYELKVD